MTSIAPYAPGAYRIPLTETWRDSDGDIIDFTSGWTFEVRIGFPGRDAVVALTSGISGASTSPNLTITFTVTGLDDLTPGVWPVEIWPTESATGKTQPPARRFIQIVRSTNP